MAVYVKRSTRHDGKPLPEDNWVWSPQGAVNMHMPERWGVVQFSDAGRGRRRLTPFVEDPNDRVKWALRRLYYRQRATARRNGRYAPISPLLNAGSTFASTGSTSSRACR